MCPTLLDITWRYMLLFFSPGEVSLNINNIYIYKQSTKAPRKMALIVNEYSPDDIIWRDYPSPSITLQGKHTFASYQSSSDFPIWRQNNNANSAINSVQEEVLHEQEKLKEEQCNIQKRSERLLSIMQQFKGMWRHCLYGNWKEGRGGRVFFCFPSHFFNVKVCALTGRSVCMDHCRNAYVESIFT